MVIICNYGILWLEILEVECWCQWKLGDEKNEVFSASDVAKSEAKTVENGVQKSTSESPVG